jgi:FtsP/CotA-like multicopper oxidase with cupredoxin domain
LFGMIIVESPQDAPADRENAVVFHDLYCDDLGALSQDFDCINGYSFLSNTPTFEAKVGERVRWRVAAIGKEKHVFHIHGHRWKSGGRYTDTMILGPGSTATIEYIEDSPGSWLYHCHVTEHMMGGMAGLYLVKP